MGDPKAMVTAFGAEEGADINVYQVAGAMNKRGFHFASCQFPPCVHLAVTLRCTPPLAAAVLGGRRSHTAGAVLQARGLH